MIGSSLLKLAAAAALVFSAGTSIAQNSQSSGNWENWDSQQNQAPQSEYYPAPAQNEYQPVDAGSQDAASTTSQNAATATPSASSAQSTVVPQKDIFTAAEGVFGKGAEGLAGLIEKILKDQGEPIAYIAGQEASGAFVLGLRYGSGVMRHQIEGERAVYWTGPSLGFDFGADASKVFVLVYNLHDSQDLFNRYPGAQGNAYALGGFTASYMRRGDVVLIPIRMGVGLRLGVNAGYMRFSEKNRWLPF
jgi:hypothetical protein